MKETGIIMTTESVRAILEGRKTQTRRTYGLEIINLYPDSWHPVWNEGSGWAFSNKVEEGALTLKCPYGQVSDRLWVRETWIPDPFHPDEILYKADSNANIERVLQAQLVKWHSPLSLPKKLARIWLEITELRVERIGQIGIGDMYKEGVVLTNLGARRDQFIYLWDSLNAKRGYGWEPNPWVWPISFRRL